jgi:hypothetical protein
MILIFTIQEDAFDCIAALINAGRVYSINRTINGAYQITMPD